MKNKPITAVYNLTIGYQSVLKITKSPIYILLFCIKKKQYCFSGHNDKYKFTLNKRNCK